MKIGFVTCVQLGLSCMEAIYSVGQELSLVITLDDKLAKNKSGRVYLDNFCSNHNIELLKIKSINSETAINAIKKANIDWLFIIGWSQIAKKEVIEAPKLGALGMHPTLLPEGRGRAPIPWAIIHNLDKTGVTLFKIDEGVDSGPIIEQLEIPLTDKTTATMLYQQVDSTQVEAIKSTVKKIISDNIVLVKQDESKVTYWEGRTPKDGEINLNDSVKVADRLVRATTHPYPGAFIIQNGIKMIIWKARICLDENNCISPAYLKFNDGYLDCLNVEYTA